jgi:hypothetical protein
VRSADPEPGAERRGQSPTARLAASVYWS